MQKSFLIIIAVLTFSFVGCDNSAGSNTKYAFEYPEGATNQEKAQVKQDIENLIDLYGSIEPSELKEAQKNLINNLENLVLNGYPFPKTVIEYVEEDLKHRGIFIFEYRDHGCISDGLSTIIENFIIAPSRIVDLTRKDVAETFLNPNWLTIHLKYSQ